jgi:hypothetical protein
LVAEVPRAEGLGVAPEPLKNNPHHGGIYGLLPLKGKPRERVQKALALRSVIIGLDV